MDLDAGTIRIRGTGDANSQQLYAGLQFLEQGMRPAFTMRGTGARIEIDFTGPFALPLDAGYLPWRSTINQLPTLEFTSPGNHFIQGDSIPLIAKAMDPEQGDISSGITWTSSFDGALGTGSALERVHSAGTHVITATVLDNFTQPVSVSRTFDFQGFWINSIMLQIVCIPLARI